MRTLETLTVQNFKSIRDQSLQLGPLNVFIGGNGSGKSNLIEVFRFLKEIVYQNLGEYTAKKGGADVLLHFGRKTSSSITIKLQFGEGDTSTAYEVKLIATSADELFLGEEISSHHDPKQSSEPEVRRLSMGAKESWLRTDRFSFWAARYMQTYRVYHFHDTSDSALMKGMADVDDNRVLRPQAENLAAFLYWLQEQQPAHLRSIEEAIRQIAPFFDRFQLAPSKLNPSKIRLEWQEKGTDTYFNASSLSDGTLRFICLATLLLQPELPPLLLVDEPELGLHPAAITLLAALLESASTRTQVIVATQSVTLVNQFEPSNVWTVDRQGHESVFRHLSDEQMSGWLDDYALGELWEKNVLGARP